MKSIIPTQHGSTLDYSSLIIPVISNITTYLENREKSLTERALIESKTQATLSFLQNRREVIIAYLNNKFGERKLLYEGYFNLIDKAISSKNDVAIQTALEGLLTLYHSKTTEDLDCVISQYDHMIDSFK